MPILELIASQLRKPSGLIGSWVTSRFLNRANLAMNQLNLELLDLEPSDCVIEVGFGGGDLVKRMIPLIRQGYNTGVDFSPEMVELCARRFAQPIKVDESCSGARA